MKKILTLAALIAFATIGNAWAHTTTEAHVETDSVNVNGSVEVNHEGKNDERKGVKLNISERLKGLRDAKACREKAAAATTEEEKNTIWASCKPKPSKEVKKDIREAEKTNRTETRELLKTQRTEMKALKTECHALVEAASDADEASVKASCKTRIEALQTTHKAALKAQMADNDYDVLVEVRDHITANLETIKAFSDEKKAQFEKFINQKLTRLKERATKDNNTVALSVVAEIEVLLGQF